MLQAIVTGLVAVLASSGFWSWMQHRDHAKTAESVILMGAAYVQITTLGCAYIERGYITLDELEELNRYSYEPYKKLGGNGVAESIMRQVFSLPIAQHGQYPDIFKSNHERLIPNVAVSSRPIEQGLDPE